MNVVGLSSMRPERPYVMNDKTRHELECRVAFHSVQKVLQLGCPLPLPGKAFARVEAELFGGLNHGF